MRFTLPAIAAIVLFVTVAQCTLLGDTPTPTPVTDVPALQTQTAALNMIATARAGLIQPTLPPIEATRAAVFTTWSRAILAGHRDDTPPTRTILAATWQPAAATLTALPTHGLR